MRHPKTDAMELQMDALLRSAADFEPDLEAPVDLVERAMQRATRRIAVVRVQRPIVALLWGGAAGAVAASAAAAILMTSPPADPGIPLQTRAAGLGTANAGYRVAAESESNDPQTPSDSRRTFRVRRTTPRAQLAVDATPAPSVAWQTENVVQSIEHTVRPALRFQVDEEGQPVNLQAGVLETLTVSEDSSACGPSDAEGSETADGTDDTSGESRMKEADLPSKED